MPNENILKKNQLLKKDKDDIIRLLSQTIVSLHTRFFNKKQLADKFSESKLMKTVNNNIKVTKYFNKDCLLNEIKYTTFPRNMKPLKNYYENI